MAEKGVDQAPVYEEFEPFCKWQRKEDRDVLEIHLQEFKKDQLKVQLSNLGILKISGERPVAATTFSKFYKEVPLPINKYNTHAIHAKFVTGSLIITLPKVIIPVPESKQKVSSAEQSKPDQTRKSGSPTSPPPLRLKDISGGAPKEQTPTPGENAPTQGQFQDGKRPSTASKLAKVAVSLAATAAAVAVLVAYVVYMYKSTVGEVTD